MTIQGTRVAFLVANEGVEEVELTEPWGAVAQAGGSPTLIAPQSGNVQMMRHLDKSDVRAVDRTIEQVTAGDFDALVLPGGVANPDQLRTVPGAVQFVQSMFNSGRPCAVICHGPWTLVEGDLVAGRTLTSWPSVKTDIHNAGGNWVDQETAICSSGPNLLLSSRSPSDLPAFCSSLLDILERQISSAQNASETRTASSAGASGAQTATGPKT